MSTPTNRAQQLFTDQKHRVRTEYAAALVWERMLSPADREQLGGDFNRAYRKLGTLGMWTTRKEVSPNRAVIDLAHGLGFITEVDRSWLLRECNELANPGDRSQATLKPCWDGQTGQLRFDNKKIKKVDVRSTKTRNQMLLAAFQSAGWPASIAQPFTPRLSQSQLTQFVYRLNQGLLRIRFYSQAGGREIRWEILPTVSEQ